MNEKLLKFLRLRLGLKPIVDYAQSRQKLCGVGELPIRTIFDVGANVGKKTRAYRKLFPEATIYCFEPTPGPFERLSRWAATQNGRVVAMNLALSSTPGNATVYWNLEHPGGSSLDQRTTESGARESESVRKVEAKVETLDRLAAKLDLRDEIFVKIDVEGHDLEVIRGGTELLRRASAVIVEIAIVDAPDGRPTFGEFVQVLGELGYMYRGNLAHAYVSGVPRNADAVFIKQPELRRRVSL